MRKAFIGIGICLLFVIVICICGYSPSVSDYEGESQDESGIVFEWKEDEDPYIVRTDNGTKYIEWDEISAYEDDYGSFTVSARGTLHMIDGVVGYCDIQYEAYDSDGYLLKEGDLEAVKNESEKKTTKIAYEDSAYIPEETAKVRLNYLAEFFEY